MTPARTLWVPKTRSVLIEVAKTRPARLLGALLGLRPGNQRVPPHDERPDARGARLGERTTRSERAARHSRAGPPGSQELSEVPVRCAPSLRHRGCPQSSFVKPVRLSQAEGEGFEPSSDETARNGFRDRRIRPLCHPSEEP